MGRLLLKDGKAELSNNLCEQRMKPIKLDLKNCQNIGSEEAADDTAFMHSLVESCPLNGKNPFEYLSMLVHKVRDKLDDAAKGYCCPIYGCRNVKNAIPMNFLKCREGVSK